MASFNDLEVGDVPESRTFHQLGILLLDGSNSMNRIGEKNRRIAENLNHGIREFLTFFKGSSIRNNFSIAAITFGLDAKVYLPATELESIDDYADYDPTTTGVDGDGTFIGAALLHAEHMANEFLIDREGDGLKKTVSIIVFSDGLCQAPDATKEIAERIKKNPDISICSTLWTAREDIANDDVKQAKSVLQDIVTDIKFYKTSYSEADLRQFFIASLSSQRHKNV
ncbi:vWA domain-containing protein [Dyadobacter aurulentus]|uniref:vWA domain-containing protein n=1 Tax=Dyadobacter sp. UC 10 TaxID=2605428 RepID=UPI0011F2E82A|nr:VWA domain-containing protein [Dyadobacter sp. UC 10]KAA0989280.1 VWA domain-containing protein [Dyadobacter sp. UC 10]